MLRLVIEHRQCVIRVDMQGDEIDVGGPRELNGLMERRGRHRRCIERDQHAVQRAVNLGPRGHHNHRSPCRHDESECMAAERPIRGGSGRRTGDDERHVRQRHAGEQRFQHGPREHAQRNPRLGSRLTGARGASIRLHHVHGFSARTENRFHCDGGSKDAGRQVTPVDRRNDHLRMGRVSLHASTLYGVLRGHRHHHHLDDRRRHRTKQGD